MRAAIPGLRRARTIADRAENTVSDLGALARQLDGTAKLAAIAFAALALVSVTALFVAVRVARGR